MLLRELKELSHYRTLFKNVWDYPENLFKFLKDSGYFPCGKGANSVVYSNPNENFVIKINDKKLDIAYLKFLEFTKQYPNIHYPKTGTLRSYNNGKKVFFVLPLEKLYPVSDSTFINIYANDVVQNYKKFVMFQKNIATFEYGINAEINDLKCQNPSLFDAITKLIDLYLSDRSLRLDLHSENFMQRNDGTIVIIDPFISAR